MSELTSCNHCTLQGIRQRARKEGKTVTVGPSDTLPGWTMVLVDGKKKATFMELSDYCCC